MKLLDLIPNPDNPRSIRRDKFDKLVKSIQQFPKMMEIRPIVIDQDRTILGGNMRYKALVHLGFDEIPDEWVKVIHDITPDQRREFVIKDNAGFGEWDWEDLANNWDPDQLSQWGLDLPEMNTDDNDPEDPFNDDTETTQWIDVNDQVPKPDDKVLVIGNFQADLTSIGGNQMIIDEPEKTIGLVNWNTTDHCECSHGNFHLMWFTNITHWSRVPTPNPMNAK